MKLRFSFLSFWLVIVLLSCKDEGSSAQSEPDLSGKFRNPVLTSAPDPWAIYHDGWYYLMHTTGNSLKLYRSKTMSDLSSADVRTIWIPPVNGMNSKNIWAPEIHFINNIWYVYYAADDGNNNNHRMWVLENSSADPFKGTWFDRGELELPDDRWAIDGTVFEHNDALYFLWSGWEGEANIRQVICIAKMSDPITIEGERFVLSVPEYDWEKNGAPPAVNEGPQFLSRNDKVFITYSASGCWTDQYSIGLLSADATDDLTDPASWVKSATPVFTSNATGKAFGPGHNSFFKSSDGKEDWIIYHANSLSGQGCGDNRSLRIQKFTWSADGFPVFGQPVSLSTYIDKPSGE
jgi:GH43 family beta-xylosidase